MKPYNPGSLTTVARSPSIEDGFSVGAKQNALRPAESFEAFARDPLGRYVCGPTWLIFFAPHGHFSGTIAWGDPDERAIREWEALADVRLSARFERHASIVDASRVERLGASGFGAFFRFVSSNTTLIERHVSRLAAIHGGGLAGATAAGFLVLWPMTFPTKAFADRDAALRWLGREQDAPILEQLHHVLDESIARAPVLRDLEAFLELHPDASPEQAARALGLSIRSLQRRLSERDTTFRRVLDTTRIRLAQRLLADSDASITDIALRVGLSSPQHLSTLFRKHGHATPRNWREQARQRRD